MRTAILAFVLILLGAGLYLGFGKGLIISNEAKNMQKNLIENQPDLPVLGKAPELRGILGWINSEPLTLEKLKGKVVLVDFWTYSCINCIRTLPYVEGWYKKYKNNGLVVLGVHAPEFDFEKDIKNVESAVKKYGVTYPVALDSDHKTWNAFDNRYWPAHYLIDTEGNIRYQHFGEGKYAETESAIQKLLLDAGLLTIDKISEVAEPSAESNLSGVGTPEIYLGYLRINNVGNMDENVPTNKPFTFKAPETIEKNKFYFVGTWKIGPEFSEYVGKENESGKLIIQYKAGKAHMVLASNVNPPAGGADIDLILDGKPIGSVKITDSKLYTLADSGDSYDWHVLEIIIRTPGLRAFTFTFG